MCTMPECVAKPRIITVTIHGRIVQYAHCPACDTSQCTACKTHQLDITAKKCGKCGAIL